MLSSTAFLLTSVTGRLLGRLAPGLPHPFVAGLSPCDWIHTWGLPAPIDVAYCDQTGLVLAVHLGVRPNRLPRRVRGAHTTWEADAGTFAGVTPGDVLELVVSPIESAP